MIQARLQINGEIKGREQITGAINGSYRNVYPKLEDIEIIPSTQEQKFKSEDYYGYNEVIVKAVQGVAEDLNEVLQEQNTLITEQETTIEDIIELLEEKMTSGGNIIVPKVENNTLIFLTGKVEGGVLIL